MEKVYAKIEIKRLTFFLQYIHICFYKNAVNTWAVGWNLGEPLNKVETVNPSHAKVMEISKKEVTGE